ncbi:hypothetical protein ACQKEY_24555 [Lysinibacillus fusiformis]|uniref:hypothetical protein n=1 Tax=Lysinibacillus fusiformis TaxID=28031 RepID=UPI003CFD97D3
MAENKNIPATWREKRITLNAGLNEYIFPDTMPNHIVINNLGASKLFLGVNVIPNNVTYEKAISPHGENMLARQTGTTRCQIYNDGTDSCDIILTSFIAEFNPSAITGNTVTSSNNSGGTGDGNVTIVGFSKSLPSGSNNIGKVEVTSMPKQTIELATLPTGTNNIGKVDVAKLPSLPAGDSHIGSVSVTSPVTIASMPPIDLSSSTITVTNTEFTLASANDHYHSLSYIGTNESVINLPFTIKHFMYISNDDTVNDLLIAFNDAVTTGGETGLNAVIRLKPGESLTDFKKVTRTIKFKRPSGTGAVRYLGV